MNETTDPEELDPDFLDNDDDDETPPTREEQKAEAIERMKLLNLYPGTIRQFETDNLVSESVPPFGACYWISGKTRDHVREFEKEFGGLVYHVIHETYNFDGEKMEMESLLYVSRYKSEWPMDRDDIRGPQKNPVVYVYNVTEPAFSEIGAITVKTTEAQGLTRIA